MGTKRVITCAKRTKIIYVLTVLVSTLDECHRIIIKLYKVYMILPKFFIFEGKIIKSRYNLVAIILEITNNLPKRENIRNNKNEVCLRYNICCNRYNSFWQQNL